jgi:hypothetical protein
MKQLKKILLSVATIALMQSTVFGQALPTLEMDYDAYFPPVGPSTTPLTVPFSMDLVNDNTYSVPATPISVTISFKNQVFTNTGYSNISEGLSFGAGATLSTGGPVQGASIESPYGLMGAYPSNGGPKSDMFTSNPYAVGAEKGTGFDVDGNLISPNLNGAVQIFTSTQVLFDSNYRSGTNVYPKDARVYFGDLVFTFSQAVKNPVIHIAGLGGAYRYLPYGIIDIAANYKSTFFSTELELVNPDYTSELLSSNGLLTLVGNNMLNNYAKPNGDSYQIPTTAPLFFDNFGAMSGSVRINGSVTQLVYHVFVKGKAISDFAWSAKGLNPNTGAQLINNATRNPYTGDIWRVAASFLAPYQQISGSVFVDADALENNNIATTGTTPNDGTNVTGILHANLVNDATGLVVATTPIVSSGAYLFDSVAVGTYHVEISKNVGTVGIVPPLAELPGTWVNTGEQIGLIPGADLVIDSKSDPVTLAIGDVKPNVNFGIQTPPNSDNKTQVIPSPIAYSIPQNTATNPVTGDDLQDGLLGNPQTIVFTALPTNGTLLYNNIPVVPGSTIVTGFDPAKLSYTNMTPGSTSITFEYAFLDRATAIDPTPATYTLTWATPLTLIDIVLGGGVKEVSNDLNWKLVGDMKDITKLDLYKKVNGGAITLAATLPANGANYVYSDTKIEKASAKYTYWVVAKEANGNTVQSNIITLDRINTTEVSIYPNPVKDVFNLLFAAETTTETDVVITDQAGKTVYRISVPASTTSSSIDISSIATGVYNVTVTNDALGTKVLQLIKK